MKELEYFSKEAMELLNQYSKTLQISIDDTIKIVSINKTAYSILKYKSGLILSNKDEILRMLIKLTLCRDTFDPITSEEKDFIKKHYKFEIEDQEVPFLEDVALTVD